MLIQLLRDFEVLNNDQLSQLTVDCLTVQNGLLLMPATAAPLELPTVVSWGSSDIG